MNESAPYPELQEGSPDSNPDGGGTRTSRAKWIQGRRPSQSASEIGNLLECLYGGGIEIPDF